MVDEILHIAVLVSQAVVVFWIAAIAAVERHRLKPFIPLLWFCIGFAGTAFIAYYSLLNTVWQSLFSLTFFIGYLVLLVDIGWFLHEPTGEAFDD